MGMNNIPAIYHETAGFAIDAATAYFEKCGAVCDFSGFCAEFPVQAMQRETSQTLRMPFASFKGKPTRKQGIISLYRFASGRYELTCYVS